MLLPISQDLQDLVKDILLAKNEEYFTVVRRIYSKTNPDIEFVPEQVVSIDIIQAYNNDLSETYADQITGGKYTDDITMVVRIHPKDYMLLVNNPSELFVDIELTYVDIENTEPLDKDPIIWNYRVLIKNAEDLAKRFNINNINPDTDEVVLEDGHVGARLDLELQLIEDTIYKVRHTKLNSILYGAKKPIKIQQFIRYLMHMFGITKEHFIEPDNDKEYTHVIIPPMLGIDSAFNYVQDQYGVYNKGFNYYYTNGIMYIYPPYETDPDIIDSTINIYNVPDFHYPGLKGYHKYKEKDLHVVSVTPVDTKNIVEAGIENEGNVISHLRADRIMDRFIDSSDSGHKVKNDNTTDVILDTKLVLEDKMANMTYQPPTINTYQYSETISKYAATMVTTQWLRSIPFSIYPGQRCIFHYDEDGEYQYKKGKVEYARYTLVPETQYNELVYSCTTTMILRLEPDKE